MKKLLSFFAAGLLAVGSLGVISCSGDLQDNDVQPLAVTGIAGTEVVPMTIPSGGDGSEQYLTFRFSEDFTFKGLDGKDKALKDGWGGLSSIQFKIVPSTELNENREPNWKVDWGGATDSGNIFVKPGADEYTALLMRGDPGTTAKGPSNVQIDGAVMNEEYTIRVKYSGNKVSVKIEGVSEDPTEMKINIVGESKNFPAKDEDKKDLTYTMNKAGKVYTYQFISVADETIEFNLSNPMCGTFYASSTKDGELELESAGKKNKKNLSYDVKKNVEYKITVDLSSVLKPTIKAEIVDMLKDAEIYANWIYADNSYTEKIVDNAYQFIAKREEIDFTVVRHDGSVWGPEQGTSVGIDSDSVLLKLDSENSLKVKNLKVGSWYKIILEKDNDAFLSAKVIQVPLADFTGMKFKGAFDGWDEANGYKGFDLTKQSDGSWTVDFTVTKDTADFEFGIYGNGNDKWCHGESITVGNDFTKVEYAGGNAKIKGAEKGKSYTLIAKPGYGSIEVKIIEK